MLCLCSTPRRRVGTLHISIIVKFQCLTTKSMAFTLQFQHLAQFSPRHQTTPLPFKSYSPSLQKQTRYFSSPNISVKQHCPLPTSVGAMCVDACMYVCACMCMCACMYVCACMCMCACMHVSVCMDLAQICLNPR